MKLLKILNITNQIEKNSFIKLLINIMGKSDNENTQIEDIKNAGNENMVEIFKMSPVQDEFKKQVKEAIAYNFNLDILIDIMIRDGNCIMSRTWFYELYSKEIAKMVEESKKIDDEFDEEKKGNVDENRKRDYLIYRNCVQTAYSNDFLQGREKVVTHDELSILNTLSDNLDLSQDETRSIYYTVLPIVKMDIDDIIKILKDLGLLFFSKRKQEVYIPEEIVRILRKMKGYEVANKHFRRVLKELKDGQIALICRKHNIDRGLSRYEKIKAIIEKGLSIRNTLTNGIFKENVNVTEKKEFINTLVEKNLKLSLPHKGVTLKDKIDNLILYYNAIEKDDKIEISNEGYEKLLKDIHRLIPDANEAVKDEFEIQGEFILDFELLLDYNIKPRDVLDLLQKDSLVIFCKEQKIKSIGNLTNNILVAYRDTKSLYLENYALISNRDYYGLRENGINIKESELGVLFEKTTKAIFEKLGLKVDESLKKKINDHNNKLDIVLKISEKEIIIIECKTHKDKEFNKFSSVYRQVKAYHKQAEDMGFKVLKSLVVASDFSDDFINECELDFDLNLSLIKATTMLNILEAFKKSKYQAFPYKLLMKDVLINEDRIITAIMKKQ
ncbi:MAG: hypothetical protein B6226_01290 [Candidatus Cloacimonetes bacterium 4572_65]|nr:MAG: hypothetical protein B6226_01290 [Candidatus Cloacimonetes bacterium 4572_65]